MPYSDTESVLICTKLHRKLLPSHCTPKSVLMGSEKQSCRKLSSLSASLDGILKSKSDSQLSIDNCILCISSSDFIRRQSRAPLYSGSYLIVAAKCFRLDLVLKTNSDIRLA